MTFLRELSVFGLLFPGLACAMLMIWGFGSRAFPVGPQRLRILGGCAFTLAGGTAVLEVAARVDLLTRPWLFAFVGGGVLASVGMGRPRSLPRGLLRAALRGLRVHWSLVPLILIATLSLLIVCIAALWLPVWQWDALGYHLPFVNFLLQDGGYGGLPPDVPYLSTYPHNVELLFAALRLLLPDDRLVDIGQLPLGLVAAAAIYGIAREIGARVPESLVAAAAWLLVPAVYLQLPTNYVDVGVAAYFLLTSFFLISQPTPRTLLAAGAALGLFLGTKPSAPPTAALLAVGLLWRGVRASEGRWALLAVLLAGGLGGEAYLTQWLRHGNPVWPAVVQLGPVHLPGTITVTELLNSGANVEKASGPLWLRILRSWFSLGARPAFDMRIGGLGPVFWLSMPLALVHLVRDSRKIFAGLCAVALVTPDPAVARYVLAFPGLLLAAAAAALERCPPWSWHASRALMALLGVVNVRYASPGLTGEGPPLTAYAGMAWSERRVAVGALGRPTDFLRFTDRLDPGDIAVFDAALALPYLMWRSDLGNRVVRVPDDAKQADAARLLERERVRLVVVGQEAAAGRAAAALDKRLLPVFTAAEHCEAFWRP